MLDSEPLVNMRLNRTQIKTILEQQWQPAGSSPAFIRLGASAGFTWTHDASRPVGDRITGMWLDGAALTPTGNYSVTVSQSLAGGGDNFAGFTSGLVPQVRSATTVSALAAYIGDGSTTGPLAVPKSQHAVGVSVPGGAQSSYVAGTTYAVDLSSWSYSAATDPKDTTVDVTIGGLPAGSFPVDNTLTDDTYDDHGTVAVRATIPADPSCGCRDRDHRRPHHRHHRDPADRRHGCARAARPHADADPHADPDADPTPTPTPTPTPPPAATKVKPVLTVKVKPGRVVATRTKAKLVIRVSATGSTPSGKVTVKVGGKKLTGTLRNGKATVTLPAFKSKGKAKVKVSYAGDALTLSAARTVKIKVLSP